MMILEVKDISAFICSSVPGEKTYTSKEEDTNFREVTKKHVNCGSNKRRYDIDSLALPLLARLGQASFDKN